MPSSTAARKGSRPRSSAARVSGMRIANWSVFWRRRADPGEVLRRGGDAGVGEPLAERGHRLGDDRRRRPERAALSCQEGLRPGDVRDRGEVDVDAARSQGEPCKPCLAPDRAALDGRVRGGARRPGPREPAHRPALLVGGDQQRRLPTLPGGGLQRSGQLPQLPGPVMFPPNRITPPISPRRARRRIAAEGRVPLIATTSRCPTSSLHARLRFGGRGAGGAASCDAERHGGRHGRNGERMRGWDPGRRHHQE